MSETLAPGTAVSGNGVNVNATALPKDQLLKSYNVFRTENPQDLMQQLVKCRTKDIPADNVDLSDQSQRFSGNYLQHTSTRETKREFSASLGIKGKYGVFSASLQVDYSKSEYQSSKSFYSSYAARIDIGNISYQGTRDTTLGLLSPDLVKELKGINNMGKAAHFTENWGTHLVTRLGLGGMLFVEVSSDTSSSEEKEKLAVKVEMSYKAALSMDMVANVASEFNKKETTSKISQHITAYGGAANKAVLVNAADKNTFKAWTDTCTKETSFAVLDSMEFYKLLDESSEAYRILKRYIDLTLMAHSLEHPLIIAEHRSISMFTTALATAANQLPQGYKIIGGGAAARMGSSSFLWGSFPQYEQGWGPTGWHAVSHDAVVAADESRDVLSAYAIAVYDPDNILEVTVVKAKGTNTHIGMDKAEVTLGNEWTMTCGGIQALMTQSEPKYIISSYPVNKHTWRAEASDYLIEAQNAVLWVYAVGIKSRDPLLVINAEHKYSAEGTSQHGDSSADSSTCICGGGVRVSEIDGKGNLVQMTYPDSPKRWREHNGDLAGNITRAKHQAFAIALRAQVKLA